MLAKPLTKTFRDTLFAGKYNLLLGSGASANSRDRYGALLRGTEELRQDICVLTGARSDTSLPRAYSLLSSSQRQTELVDRYSHCQPGRELIPLRQYLWKRIFTFNIDDVVENLYVGENKVQEVQPINFNSVFIPDTNVSEVQCIHLHGHAKQPEPGFVFSHNEYARILQGNNPWMLLLSEILPSDSFIIAGTSLNEVDLEYYLTRRTSNTPRRGRGPSLLIEPSPDAATRADCERYDLTLVEAEFGEFLAWVKRTFPNPPSARKLIVPPVKELFRSEVAPATLLRFFNDFELVTPKPTTENTTPRPYMYGAEPTWSDIEEHLDVERHENQVVMNWFTNWLIQPSADERTLLISGEPATGKSTLLRRVGHDLASLGHVILHVRTLAKIDVRAAAQCLRQRTSPSIILVDNFADYVEQVRDLLDETRGNTSVAILGVERGYRREHIDVIMSDVPLIERTLGDPIIDEIEQLLEKYRQAGLIADRALVQNLRQGARTLLGESMAISVCRILNDFRPLDRIVGSLWDAATAVQRRVYVSCALAHRCHSSGVRQSVMQMIAGSSYSMADSLGPARPLPLAFNSSDDDFLLPQSVVIGERVLDRVAKQDPGLMIDVFTSLAQHIAPRVNRMAIRMRTPEARLAGRLFDADKIVRPLLRAYAEEFYIAAKDTWEWNSRYWEQRALLIADRDIRTALQFARHAVAIEVHPYPLTTLGKMLLKSLDSCAGDSERARVYGEAFSALSQAISVESRHARVTIHPFSTLLLGTSKFLEDGGNLTLEQHDAIRRYMDDARFRYGEDLRVVEAVKRLDSLM